MNKEWMGKCRDAAQALIHYCNVYEGAYKKAYNLSGHFLFPDADADDYPTNSFSVIELVRCNN